MNFSFSTRLHDGHAGGQRLEHVEAERLAIRRGHGQHGRAPQQRQLVRARRVGDEAQDALSEELYQALESAGIDVMWDDRKKVNPGAKFKDADLVGIPLRLVVGRDAAERKIEWNPRQGDDKDVMSFEAALERAKAFVKGE